MHSNGRFDALVADSCQLMNDGVVRCLESGGYTATRVVTTVQALQPILGGIDSERGHLVVLGPHLPESDAFAFCRSLDSPLTLARAILVVANADDPLLLADAAAVGAAACLGHTRSCDELLEVC